jgi:peptide/nickel transport system substrate-binding protein
MVEQSDVQDPEGIGRRSFLARSIAIGALVGLPPSVLAACGSGGGAVGTTAAAGVAVGTAIGAFSHAFGELDPHIGVDQTTYTVGWHVYEGLMNLNPVTRQVERALAGAEPEKVSDTLYRVPLREGATFHDGTPVKASDVVFSFERIRDPKTASFYAPYLEFIDTVRAVDDATVEIKLNRPFALFRDRLIFIRVVPEAVVVANAKALSLKPVGTGPYSFVELVANDHLTMRKFPKYGGDEVGPYDTITLRSMEDLSARLAALRGDEVGVMEDPADRDLPSLAKAGGIKTESKPGFAQTLMLFNHARKPFDDPRVRQAIMYAIDREALVKAVYDGHATVADSLIPSTYPGYVKPTTTYSYDPERAKSLLAAAGHSDFTFELMVNSLSYVGAQAPFIKEQMAAAGIDAKLRLGDSQALFARVTGGQYSAFITISDTSIFGQDPDLWLRYIYSGAFAKQFLYWDTPETKQVQKLLDDALYAPRAQQLEMWAKIQNIVADQAVCPSMIHRAQPTAWRDSLPQFQPVNTTGLYFLAKAA